MSDKNHRQEKPAEQGGRDKWIKVGYTKDGKLIQINARTHEYRILSEWIEIIRDK